MDNRPIGVFDSGLGGLTAMRELIRTLPNESILYFGATGRVPYGSRGRHQRFRLLPQGDRASRAENRSVRAGVPFIRAARRKRVRLAG